MHEESLSALFDGECTKEEIDSLLNTLEHSPQLRERWSRMSLAREAGRGMQCKKPDLDLADRVRAAVAAESAANVSEAAPGRRWQPRAGLALAATVAGVAVISSWFRTPEETQAPQAAVTASVPSTLAAAASMGAGVEESSGLQTVALGPQAPARSQRPDVMDPEMQRQINNYLAEYNNYRALQGMGGTFGYARFASHQAVYRPDDDH